MKPLLGAMCLLVCSSAASSQDAGSLADIRAELGLLQGQMQALRAELSPTTTPSVRVTGDLLQRVDGIESELGRLTAKTESLENRINQIVADGTNRVGDLEFRLLELEGGDLSSLGTTPPLGGQAAAAPVQRPSMTEEPEGAEMAVSERQDFERAQEALASGDFLGAAEQFAAFNQTYPGGPLSADAFFFQGEALEKAGSLNEAARAYLESFSGNPQSARAPQALYRLGLTLYALDQQSEACIMLSEVILRYPNSDQVAAVNESRQSLNCG